MPVTSDMVVRGIEQASADPVKLGNTGGGTGMMCSGFKAGTGSASRIIHGAKVNSDGTTEETEYTIAALVQTNFGKKDCLRFCGVPVGRLHIEHDEAQAQTESKVNNGKTEATEEGNPHKEGSIIVVIATSAPLHPLQLQRLAKRATSGVSRLGGWGSNSSGDVFIAFSTGFKLPRDPPYTIWSSTAAQGGPVVHDTTMNSLLESAADVTEEAIYDSMCMAQTTYGPEGRVAEAIPLDWLKETMEKHAVNVPYMQMK